MNSFDTFVGFNKHETARLQRGHSTCAALKIKLLIYIICQVERDGKILYGKHRRNKKRYVGHMRGWLIQITGTDIHMNHARCVGESLNSKAVCFSSVVENTYPPVFHCVISHVMKVLQAADVRWKIYVILVLRGYLDVFQFSFFFPYLWALTLQVTTRAGRICLSL